MIDRPTRAPSLSVALSVICAVLLLGALVIRIEPLGRLFARVATPLALALVALLAAYGVGALTQRALRASFARLGAARSSTDESDPLSSLMTALIVGVPLHGTLCFLLACVSAALVPMALVLGVPAVLGVFMLSRSAVWTLRADATPPLLSALVVFAALAIGMVVAQLPPVTLDELAYHLAVPRAYLAEGRVVELPLNSQSYFPFGGEAVAIATMAVAGPEGALAHHFVVLATAAAAVVLGFRFLAKRVDQAFAWLGAAALATTPALVLIAGTSWVDWPLLGATFTLLMALDRVLSSEHADAEALAIAASGVAAGLACKYTFFGVLAAHFGGALIARRPTRARVAWLCAAALAGGLLGCVFLVRNLIWTGNPVAPFLDPAAPHVSNFHGSSGLLGTLLGYVHEPSMVDESLGASLFQLALVCLLCLGALQKEPFLRAVAVLSFAVLSLAMATGAAGRLLVPFLATTSLVGCVALARTVESTPAALPVVRSAFLFTCVVQLIFAITAVDAYRPFTVLGEGRSDADLVRASRRLFAPIRWADERLPESSKTLVLGIQELYWFSHRVRGGGNFDGPRVARYLGAETPAALRERWRADGFTHVAIYPGNLIIGQHAEAGRRAESVTVMDKRTADTLRETLRVYGRALGSGEGLTLFLLGDSGPVTKAP